MKNHHTAAQILKNAKEAIACEDAVYFLEGLDPRTELPEIISAARSNATEWAGWYAQYVIKGRWPEAEATINTDPDAALWYAQHIIEGRWPEAEATIAAEPYTKRRYENHFGVKI